MNIVFLKVEFYWCIYEIYWHMMILHDFLRNWSEMIFYPLFSWCKYGKNICWFTSHSYAILFFLPSKKIFSIIDFKDRFDPSEPLDFCGDLFDPKCKRCAYSDPERRFSTYFSCVYKPLQRAKNSICYNIHST